MIIEVNPNKKNKICSPVIGFEAENKVTGFEFDYSDWAADIGDGYLTLSVKRPTDTIPYPVSLTQTGTHKATWTVSSTDVAFAGRGEVQLTYIVDDKVKKSAIYEIYIDRSLEPDGDIPDPYISWFEELLQVSVQVEADADRAEAAADSIKNLEAVAATLPSGESATAEYDPETGVMSFGIPKGDKGDTGDVGPTGNGISSTVLNADYTLTINFTDGTSYTTPSIRGEQGIQGETGEAGNGIASTVLNPDYTLTITFTNGTTYTTPSIRGPEGAQGQPGPAGNGIDNVTMDASGYLTITFTDGSTWTSPTSLIGPVKDVKVNGESVVDENGVANITVPIITKTVSGNPIVLDDADGAVQALDVELLPVQDLHGYDKPWGAGAGNNKFDESTLVQGNWNYEGPNTPNNVVTHGYLPIKGGITYMWSQTELMAGRYIRFYDANQEYDASGDVSQYNATNVTFNAPQWAAYMRVMWYSITAITPNDIKALKPQIEEGSTATSWEPYSNICPITGHDSVTVTDTDGDSQSQSKTVTLPHTVYGADVDVTGGNGKSTMATVDMGALNWTYETNIASYGTFRASLNPTPKLSGLLVCSALLGTTKAPTELNDGECSVRGSLAYPYLRVRLDNYTDAASFKTAMSGVYLCYELATPTDLQTTPTDVELYKGDNVVSGDGNMTLTYVRNLQKVIDKIESAL